MRQSSICLKNVLKIFLAGLWVSWLATVVSADMPFDLPACTNDLGGAVVLSPAALDAMLEQAQPAGGHPDAQAEQLFVLLKHYLTQNNGLLLVPGVEGQQTPVLLTMACTPAPRVSSHVRTYLMQLPPEDKQRILAYYALVLPPGPQQEPPPVVTPATDTVVIPGGQWRLQNGASVTLRAFTMDVYEITNAQYQRFIEANGYATETLWTPEGWAWVQSRQRRQPTYWEDERFHAPDQPVVGVSWYEAAAYCRWAGKALPSEAQWERACRGPDGRPFPWGKQPLSLENTTANPAAFVVPVAVGSTPATQSPYGIQDLAGNVLEWTSTTAGKAGVLLCGGSGHSTSPHVGCGVRLTLLPGLAANFIGFRCQAEVP